MELQVKLSTLLQLIVVFGSASWVLVDAVRLGVRRGVIGGRFFGDLGIVTWVLIVVLMWIVGLPAYLLSRPRYVALRREFPTGPLPRPEAREAMQAASRQRQAAASRQMQEAASRQMVETVRLEEAPVEGWFPDASGFSPPGTLRYWDGHAWTAKTREAASQSFPHGSVA
jgi:Protein of unknown function (DUF2510)